MPLSIMLLVGNTAMRVFPLRSNHRSHHEHGLYRGTPSIAFFGRYPTTGGFAAERAGHHTGSGVEGSQLNKSLTEAPLYRPRPERLDGEAIMNTERELTIDELNAVSGGALFIVLAQMAAAAKDTSGYPDFSGRP